uniref:Si:ch211-131k2.3 n=1 Tax=Sinocyclocheilus rhinocerous TaxID=307959 RepID=A0A673FTY6_9TELE
MGKAGNEVVFNQPEHWYDRKKYVTINFVVQNPKDVQVDIQDTKIILSCKDESKGKCGMALTQERSRKGICPSIHPSIHVIPLIIVSLDWEHEEEDGMAEYEQYMDTNGEPPAMDDLDDLSD